MPPDPRRERRPAGAAASEPKSNNDSQEFKAIGSLMQAAVDRLRLQRLAEHLHTLGPRPVYELLAELATLYGPGVWQRVENYHRLDPAVVRAVGGDRFPSAPMRVVGGGR